MRSFQIPDQYQSTWVADIKTKRRLEDPKKLDFSPSYVEFSEFDLYLPRHFGFCFGVENAVEMVYQCLEQHPNKNLFLLSEMIHNPLVNQDLQEKGIRFLHDTKGNLLTPWETLKNGDLVIIPAFGMSLEMKEKLENLGVELVQYDTTCPFVERVWNKAKKLGAENYTLIIHGKSAHEETRATFSRSQVYSACMVLKNLEEAKKLEKYLYACHHPQDKNINWVSLKEEFYQEFEGKYSKNFDPEQHLQRIAVINQTTMLADKTNEIAQFFKQLMIDYHQENAIPQYFADTRDTLCYATNDNQMATKALLDEPIDLVLVIGGYNSSNTSNLAELFLPVFPTYFIADADHLIALNQIKYFDLKTQTMQTQNHYFPIFPEKKTKIAIVTGASCPDAMVEKVVDRLRSFF